MANPSKAKGTRAETKVVRYLEAHGFTARRQALAGSDDQGDIEAYAPGSNSKLIIEVKAGKQTAAPNRSQIVEWCRQTKVEATNAKGFPVLVVVRYRRELKDADVYFPGLYNREHWFFDDWVEFEEKFGKAFDIK